MTMVANGKFRDDLENQGINVGNDLTKNQAEIVAAAKRGEKAGFVKKDNLVVEPRRPDPRSYAQISADVTGATTEGSLTLEQSAGRVNTRGQMSREYRHPDGDSPHAKKTDSGGEHDTHARANRGGVHTAVWVV